MEVIGRLRSLPRVNGTIQYEHMLSQPLIIDLKNEKTMLMTVFVKLIYQ